MALFKKKRSSSSNLFSELIGNELSKNAQKATTTSFSDMSNFLNKASSLKNVSFVQGKGNLFEYIEAAKFNKDAALKGVNAQAIVTDLYESHNPADILIKSHGEIVDRIQAKFIKTSSDGRDTSAASSVYHMTGAHNKGWGQYDGMTKLIRKEENYNSRGSLLNETKEISGRMAKSGNIHKDIYKDINETLTDETKYKNVSSGGTTFEEVKTAFDNPKEFSDNFIKEQYKVESKVTSHNMAKVGAITSGVISGVVNLFDVYKDEKKLDEAVYDVTKAVVKGGIRGYSTGKISSAIRYKGLKKGNALLSDSTSATVMASGLIDGGVSLYKYAKGEIDSKELCEELSETTVKSTSTIFYTKAVNAIVGHANPMLPFAIYTSASYIFTATKSIIKNAKLNAQEFNRMSELLREESNALDKLKNILNEQLNIVEYNNRKMLNDFIDKFDFNIQTGENYDIALNSIVNFANQAGYELQDSHFEEFEKKMNDEEYIFVLGDFTKK